MKKFLLIIFFFIFGGCKFTKENLPPTDKEFIEFIKKFEDLYGHKIEVPIYFKNLEYTTIGVCYIYNYKTNRVYVDPDYWPILSKEQKETLIFHELAHCVLNKDHNDSHFNDGCPVSIMRSYLFNLWEIENCYISDYDYYIDELFD